MENIFEPLQFFRVLSVQAFGRGISFGREKRTDWVSNQGGEDSFRGKGMKQIFSAMGLTFLLALPLALAAESPVGKWKTVDEKTGKVTSEVEIYEQNGKLFGKIAALTEPNDKQGKPKICTACTGADKDKPLLGLVFIKDLSRSGERYNGGTILDPESGKIYTAEIWVEDGKLKLRGYVGLFYRTQTWPKGS